MIKYQTKHLLPFDVIKDQNNSVLLVYIENECERYKHKKPHIQRFWWYYQYERI